MMVRLIEPHEGMRIYDPCSGSGGMLILSKEYVEERRQSRNLELVGQENNGGAWAISQDEPAVARHPWCRRPEGDTIKEPQHIEGGSESRFDRVIANPPFSLRTIPGTGCSSPSASTTASAPRAARRPT